MHSTTRDSVSATSSTNEEYHLAPEHAHQTDPMFNAVVVANSELFPLIQGCRNLPEDHSELPGYGYIEDKQYIYPQQPNYIPPPQNVRLPLPKPEGADLKLSQMELKEKYLLNPHMVYDQYLQENLPAVSQLLQKASVDNKLTILSQQYKKDHIPSIVQWLDETEPILASTLKIPEASGSFYSSSLNSTARVDLQYYPSRDSLVPDGCGFYVYSETHKQNVYRTTVRCSNVDKNCKYCEYQDTQPGCSDLSCSVMICLHHREYHPHTESEGYLRKLPFAQMFYTYYFLGWDMRFWSEKHELVRFSHPFRRHVRYSTLPLIGLPYSPFISKSKDAVVSLYHDGHKSVSITRRQMISHAALYRTFIARLSIIEVPTDNPDILRILSKFKWNHMSGAGTLEHETNDHNQVKPKPKVMRNRPRTEERKADNSNNDKHLSVAAKVEKTKPIPQNQGLLTMMISADSVNTVSKKPVLEKVLNTIEPVSEKNVEIVSEHSAPRTPSSNKSSEEHFSVDTREPSPEQIQRDTHIELEKEDLVIIEEKDITKDTSDTKETSTSQYNFSYDGACSTADSTPFGGIVDDNNDYTSQQDIISENVQEKDNTSEEVSQVESKISDNIEVKTDIETQVTDQTTSDAVKDTCIVEETANELSKDDSDVKAEEDFEVINENKVKSQEEDLKTPLTDKIEEEDEPEEQFNPNSRVDRLKIKRQKRLAAKSTTAPKVTKVVKPVREKPVEVDDSNKDISLYAVTFLNNNIHVKLFSRDHILEKAGMYPVSSMLKLVEAIAEQAPLNLPVEYEAFMRQGSEDLRDLVDSCRRGFVNYRASRALGIKNEHDNAITSVEERNARMVTLFQSNKAISSALPEGVVDPMQALSSDEYRLSVKELSEVEPDSLRSWINTRINRILNRITAASFSEKIPRLFTEPFMDERFLTALHNSFWDRMIETKTLSVIVSSSAGTFDSLFHSIAVKEVGSAEKFQPYVKHLEIWETITNEKFEKLRSPLDYSRCQDDEDRTEVQTKRADATYSFMLHCTELLKKWKLIKLHRLCYYHKIIALDIIENNLRENWTNAYLVSLSSLARCGVTDMTLYGLFEVGILFTELLISILEIRRIEPLASLEWCNLNKQQEKAEIILTNFTRMEQLSRSGTSNAGAQVAAAFIGHKNGASILWDALISLPSYLADTGKKTLASLS